MSTRILQIRAAQMEALRVVPLQEYEARLAEHLRKNFSEQVRDKSEEQLLELVREGMRKAKEYDVASRTNIRRFVEHMLGFGGNFDTEPWAREILTSTRFRETDKLDKIDSHEQFQRNRS